MHIQETIKITITLVITIKFKANNNKVKSLKNSPALISHIKSLLKMIIKTFFNLKEEQTQHKKISIFYQELKQLPIIINLI
jgi:hypothetical protein